jgi:hypothetical protein
MHSHKNISVMLYWNYRPEDSCGRVTEEGVATNREGGELERRFFMEGGDVPTGLLVGGDGSPVLQRGRSCGLNKSDQGGKGHSGTRGGPRQSRGHFSVSGRQGRLRSRRWTGNLLRSRWRPGHRISNHITDTRNVSDIRRIFSNVRQMSCLPGSPRFRHTLQGEGERLVVGQHRERTTFQHKRKCLMPATQAHNSQSNAEYLVCAGSSFFKKKSSGSHTSEPGRRWCSPAPTWEAEASTASLSSAPGMGWAR